MSWQNIYETVMYPNYEFELVESVDLGLKDGEKVLGKTIRDFRAIYNELTPDEQTRLVQLMVQKVVLGKDTLKISIFPLGDSRKPLEYLLKHPEFAESDKKRPQYHSQKTFVEFEYRIQLHYAMINKSRWKVIEYTH